MEQNIKRIILLIVVMYFFISYFNMINEIELLVVLKVNDSKNNKWILFVIFKLHNNYNILLFK